MLTALADYQWLVSDAAQVWLSRTDEVALTPTWMARLRRELSAERAALIATQCELRKKARRKFSAADELFFESIALEQATDETIAGYKATMFRPLRHIADLCCGIGGDAMSFSLATGVTAVEQDPVRALLAEANLIRRGGTTFRVHSQDALQLPLEELDGWHIDPDRRADGRRTILGEQMSPSTEQIAERLARNSHAVMKVAPASRIPHNWRDQAQQEWIGHSRQCQQQIWRFGHLAHFPGKRVATVLSRNLTNETFHLVEQETAPRSCVEQVGAFLIEPHAAVIAAGLADQYACERGLQSLPTRVPYYSSDRPCDHAASWCYAVAATMPFDERRVRQWLRAHHARIADIKKRGVELKLSNLARRLATPGDRPMTLITFPVRNKVVAVLAERRG
jgi:hypothetical protein